MKNTNNCIGIVSYLPNDIKVREQRKKKLSNLLLKLKELFNFPIILIAQNYSEKEIELFQSYEITLLKYNKPLGIAHAREELRKYFISTNYSGIILFDDDSEIIGENATNFIEQINTNHDKLCSKYYALHKLMYIPRNIYEKYSYNLDFCPEKKNAFEDQLFYWKIYGDNKEQIFNLRCEELEDASNSKTTDEFSTWSNNVNKEERELMAKNTKDFFIKYTGIKIFNLKRSGRPNR